MRTITVKKEIYHYDELSQEVQNKVVDDYINFLLECDGWEEDSFVNKAIKQANRMQTPWFVGSYVFEYGEKQILADVCEHEYFKDGNLFVEQSA